MILGRDLITALGLDLKYSENLIIGGAGPYELCLVPMADLSNYGFKSLAENIVKPEQYFIDSYVNKFLEFENSIHSTRKMHRILDAKYKNSDLNTVMTEQCQYLSPRERESLLDL